MQRAVWFCGRDGGIALCVLCGPLDIPNKRYEVCVLEFERL